MHLLSKHCLCRLTDFFPVRNSSNRGLSIIVITLGTLYYTWIKSSGGPPRGPVALPPSPATQHDVEKQALAGPDSKV